MYMTISEKDSDDPIEKEIFLYRPFKDLFSVTYIAVNTGHSRRKVRDVIKRLEKSGLVRRYKPE